MSDSLLLKSTISSLVLRVLKMRLLEEHHADSFSTCSLYAVLSPPEMSPSTTRSSATLMIALFGRVWVQPSPGLRQDDAHPLGAVCQEVANPGANVFWELQVQRWPLCFGMMVLKVERKSTKISQAQLPSCGVESCSRGIFSRHVCPVCNGQILVGHVYYLHGFPREIVSDQSQGKRTNQTLESVLRCVNTLQLICRWNYIR